MCRILVTVVLTLGIATPVSAAQIFRDVTASQYVAEGQVVLIDLFSNPDVLFTASEFVPGPPWGWFFGITIDNPGTEVDILSVTWVLDDGRIFNDMREVQFPGRYNPRLGPLLDCCFEPQRVRMVVDLLGSSPDFRRPDTGALVDSWTYQFRIQHPIPEPASLALIGSGALLLLGRQRRCR
ncbi:MAG: PEP-CTERM sorting domain-containing protein [Acidimicrobiia bacterium]